MKLIIFMDYKEWLRLARQDLESAKIVFKQKLYYVVAFLLHQALEKGLKALYIRKFEILIKIHNLIFLAKKLDLPKKFLNTFRRVNPFYIESRYPPLAVRSRYKEKDIKALIKKVEEVIEWLEKTL